MPGTFAHMLASQTAARRVKKSDDHFAWKCMKQPIWLRAGSVAPDYPYLHWMGMNKASSSWADAMHYEDTGDVVRAGASILAQEFQRGRSPEEDRRFHRKSAWLFGYLSHVILDVTIHPVVRAIVGDYDENKTEHRKCEMYQDAYIFQQIKNINLVNTEWTDTLVAISSDDEKFHEPTKILWAQMLTQVHGSNKPLDIDAWHEAYINVLDVADIDALFFRHALAESATAYVKAEYIDDAAVDKFILDIATPSNKPFPGDDAIDYEEVFNFGVRNILRYWKMLSGAIQGTSDPALPELLNWNLDTGIPQEEDQKHGVPTFWK